MLVVNTGLPDVTPGPPQKDHAATLAAHPHSLSTPTPCPPQTFDSFVFPTGTVIQTVGNAAPPDPSGSVSRDGEPTVPEYSTLRFARPAEIAIGENTPQTQGITLPASFLAQPTSEALDLAGKGSLIFTPQRPPQTRPEMVESSFDAATPQPQHRTHLNLNGSQLSVTMDDPFYTPTPQIQEPANFNLFDAGDGIAPLHIFSTLSGNSPLSTPTRDSSAMTPTAPSTGSSSAKSSMATSSPISSPRSTSSSPMSTPSSTSGSSMTSRNRVSSQNPIYGYVNGAFKGNKVCRIVRKQALREPAKASDASYRFRREMPIIISRAERLAVETNGWIFVAGEQRNPQSNDSFWHYASPELVNDSWDSTKAMIEKFGDTVQALLAYNKNKVQEELQALNAKYRSAIDGARHAEEEKIAAIEDAQCAEVEKLAALEEARRIEAERAAALEATRRAEEERAAALDEARRAQEELQKKVANLDAILDSIRRGTFSESDLAGPQQND
ncbi:hypothetical protein H0H81_005202 [Sphagnurus paluster]|uniref:Uncharacterized protein n=1 Tax=Sphagnurus paluster TaxID=117069 RepID=A0A9P7FNN6_9AGAR|nr:hypothetical protein H0H81_005202 [Sphagnurus paluster]